MRIGGGTGPLGRVDLGLQPALPGAQRSCSAPVSIAALACTIIVEAQRDATLLHRQCRDAAIVKAAAGAGIYLIRADGRSRHHAHNPPRTPG